MQICRFDPAQLHSFLRLVKSAAQSCTLPVQSVINLIWSGWCSLFRLVNHNDSSTCFAINNLAPGLQSQFLVLGAGLEKSKITELACEKSFCRVSHILSTAGVSVISVPTSNCGTASMLCSNSGNGSISRPPPWPWFSVMNVVTICCNSTTYYCLLACLLFVIEVLEVGCLRAIQCGWEWIKHLGISSCCI